MVPLPHTKRIFWGFHQGALWIELGGTVAGDNFDRLVVTGTTILAGRLVVSLVDDFEPEEGHRFDILDAVAADGEFDELVLPGLRDGYRWEVSALYTQGSLSVVPDPGTFVLLLVGVVLALSASRLQRWPA